MTIDVVFVELGALPAQPVWSVAEAARAADMPSTRARDAYLIMRHVLRHLLARRMRVPPRALVFSPGRYGKPYITGPTNTPAPAFSLAHTRGCGVIAMADGPVGVDLEVATPRIPGTETLATFLAPEEREQLRAVASAHRARRFARLWTQREAVVKLHGGSVATFAEACVIRAGRVAWTEAAPQVDADLTPGGRVALRVLRTPVGYVGAVAALGHAMRLRYLPLLRGPVPEHDLDRSATDVGGPMVAREVEGGDQPVESVVQLAQDTGEWSPAGGTRRRGQHEGPQDGHRDQA